MSPSMLPISALSLCLLLLLTTTVAASDGAKHVKKACKATEKPSLCEKAVLGYPESLTASSLQLAGLVLNYAKDRAATAQQESRKAADNAKNEGMVRLQETMDECAEHFYEAFQLVTDSVELHKSRSLDALIQSLQGAMTETTSCIEDCESMESSEDVQRISKFGDEIFDLCNIVLTLSHQEKLDEL